MKRIKQLSFLYFIEKIQNKKIYINIWTYSCTSALKHHYTKNFQKVPHQTWTRFFILTWKNCCETRVNYSRCNKLKLLKILFTFSGTVQKLQCFRRFASLKIDLIVNRYHMTILKVKRFFGPLRTLLNLLFNLIDLKNTPTLFVVPQECSRINVS